METNEKGPLSVDGCRIAADTREACLAQIADRPCDHQRALGSAYCACHPLAPTDDDEPVSSGLS